MQRFFPGVCAAALLICAGCMPAGGVTSPAATGHVTLVASGDTQGWLVPCGCTSNQSGGLLRRATYFNSLPNQDCVLRVDVGGAPGGTSPYDILRFEAILRGEVEMKLAAHNIGAAEAALGADTLKELQVRTGAPFLSTNLQDADGKLLFPALHTVAIGGLQVAILGVASPQTTGDGIRAVEPKWAILKALREAIPRPDRVIVLAYLPEDELKTLAEQLPEVHAILGGPTGQAMTPRKVGPTVLAAATNKGKFVIELPLTKLDGDDIGKVVELGPDFADDAAQLANLKRYLAELSERDLSAEETSFAPPKSLGGTEDRIAGSESCRECHAAEHETWSASGHASAWKTLVEKEFQVDPYCQHCHTTGYGRPGGFQSAKRSAALGGVGCEDCHGPSQRHVADAAIRTPWNAADRCTACHDHENSPHFEFGTYWPQILHGKEPPP